MEITEKAHNYMTIRLDSELKKIIVDLAKREHRSLMQQVITLVEEAMEARKQLQVKWPK